MEEGTLDVDDRRLVDFFGFKQDWTWTVDPRHLLKWGVAARWEEAEYDYSRRSVIFDPGGNQQPESTEVEVDAEPAGASWGAYIADRIRLTERLVVEVYNKGLSDLRPRFENLFNPIDLFPEGALDRVRIAPDKGRSYGFEVLLRKDAGRQFDWWATYSLSRTEDSIQGDWVPRSWDQRHAAGLGVNWHLPRNWSLNLAGTFHSGWPTTNVSAVPKMPCRWDAKTGSYSCANP